MAAGAGAIHVHPRDGGGVESLRPDVCDATLLAIRWSCPGLPVGLSTGEWIEPDKDRRLDLVERWTERPDFVSVNFSEPGAVELCELLRRIGIGIEAGLSTVADAQVFVASGVARHVVRVLVEPEDQDPGEAAAHAAAMDAVLDHAGIGARRLHHGVGLATWRVIEDALDAGRDVRVGLEDTLQMPDGSRAPGNAELVATAVAMARRRGRLP
jgi:uncharacterized protein (DUF849 family)